MERVAGAWRDARLPARALGAELAARVWSPPGAGDRVLVVHDGPDYDEHAELGRAAAQWVESGRVPPFHLVLLPAGERFEWYAASPTYARTLTGQILPRITDAPVVGVGASLGALAMLHAQRRAPARFAGLFLQSGSFFQPRFDAQERGFERYLRIVRFTGAVVRAADGPAVPVTLTCGTVEENLANNRDMAAALRRQGYEVAFAESGEGHNWVNWRDTLDPHLINLLRRVWP